MIKEELKKMNKEEIIKKIKNREKLTEDEINFCLYNTIHLYELYVYEKLTEEQINKALEIEYYLWNLYKYQTLNEEQINKALEIGEYLDDLYKYQKLTENNINKNSKEDEQFKEALKSCEDIRLNRGKKYGDSWKKRREYQTLALIKEKVDRLECNFESDNKDYENKEDTLIDLINYSIFYLQNLKDNVYKK